MIGPVLRGLPSTQGVAADPPLGGGPPSTRRIVADSDGCLVCGGIRPELAVEHGDPFCTNRCARAFYGCPLDPATERPASRAA